ncbi:hypothetical protein [Salipaludibacillus daqingensis]|nr:hypothetical protein [Salipaludibacillus daqingensis]
MKEIKTDMALVDPDDEDEEDRWRPQGERIRNSTVKRKIVVRDRV